MSEHGELSYLPGTQVVQGEQLGAFDVVLYVKPATHETHTGREFVVRVHAVVEVKDCPGEQTEHAAQLFDVVLHGDQPDVG